MNLHNLLPVFSECMRRWEKPPTLAQFKDDYYRHIRSWVEGVLWVEDASSLHEELVELDWGTYRERTLRLDPSREEARVRARLADVERVLGLELTGEILLFGSFEIFDGYARFDRGSHQVFLGVDESFEQDRYLDILIAHELTHVARESRPEVWEGWGLSPRMTSHEFGENQPVIEHVFGEGFSCTVSELIVPGQDPWLYAYQSREGLQSALEHAAAIDARIKREISLPHAKSDYTRLYNSRSYGAPVPGFSQYVWGWQWTKRLLAERAGGDPTRLLRVCSKELLESAREFELKGLR